MYLDYSQYTEYGGVLSETEFNRLNYKAQRFLDFLTFNRLALVPPTTQAKRCVFELIDYLNSHDVGGVAKSVQSLSNDGYAVTYISKETAKKEMFDIVCLFFADTGLMYRGIDGDSIRPMLDVEPDKGYEYLQVQSEDSASGFEYLQVEAENE